MLSNANITVPGAPWYLQNVWANGHVGIVRSLLFDEEVCDFQALNLVKFNVPGPQNQVLVTGGEDSKINVWPILPPQNEDTMDVDFASRKRSLDLDDEHVRAPWY